MQYKKIYNMDKEEKQKYDRMELIAYIIGLILLFGCVRKVMKIFFL